MFKLIIKYKEENGNTSYETDTFDNYDRAISYLLNEKEFGDFVSGTIYNRVGTALKTA